MKPSRGSWHFLEKELLSQSPQWLQFRRWYLKWWDSFIANKQLASISPFYSLNIKEADIAAKEPSVFKCRDRATLWPWAPLPIRLLPYEFAWDFNSLWPFTVPDSRRIIQSSNLREQLCMRMTAALVCSKGNFKEGVSLMVPCMVDYYIKCSRPFCNSRAWKT